MRRDERVSYQRTGVLDFPANHFCFRRIIGLDFTRETTLYNFESKFGWVTKTDEALDMLERSQAS